MTEEVDLIEEDDTIYCECCGENRYDIAVYDETKPTKEVCLCNDCYMGWG